ncbi:protein transporter YIF1 NDAI_0F04150 [Naumovozyma dairenensis CBS 421]|uniref:Protein YIF1 n=1 Tax=Naumovozyma dairenensis (strain ATCC 10597 / BCRC 20456 / CBS 421 / NBRC 0211 / NRRL Y-12639) TaxID=1071378 RepID=G0WD72_NAUDC|nr:hypothetical protein NDAI_0F04150 [Naumovozyma dairenensis CBS 421]CCD25733.1 hypothetical protein NDAI_0F04150 [Naumovozyma dairenensis CBS 421]
MSYNPYASYAAAQADPTVNNLNDRAFTHGGVPNNGNAGYAQQPQQQYQQHQQRQGGGMPFQDPRSSMAFQLGQSAFSNFIGQENFNQFQETVSKVSNNGSTTYLSHYFQVSTSYVLQKLKQILFPYLNKNNWQRIPDSQSKMNGGNGNPNAPTMNGPSSFQFMSPKDDSNCPDLYIPIMGLITYILIWNTQQGLQGSFNPEDLYYKLSSILGFMGLDLFILKLGLYLLVSTHSPVTSLVELTCFVGYKFVPLTLSLFIPTSKIPWYVPIFFKSYLFLAFGVFLLRSVKFNLFSNPNDDMINIKKSTVKKCNYFLFFYGFLWQTVLMWLMG